MRLPPHITDEVYNKVERCFLHMLLAKIHVNLNPSTILKDNWIEEIFDYFGVDINSLGIDNEDMEAICRSVNDQLDSIRAEIKRQ